MQFKSIVTSFTLLAAAVTALPNNPVTITVTDTQTVAQPVQTVVSQCNTGSQVCCNVVGDSTSSAVTSALGLAGVLDLLLGDITGIVGVGCVNAVGSACNEQAACCTDVQFNGLINVGCSPINL